MTDKPEMKLLLIDEVPENPYHEGKDARLLIEGWNQCRNTILSKAIPIEEIDKLVLGWLDTTPMPCFGYDGDNLWQVEGIPLSQYLQQQIVK